MGEASQLSEERATAELMQLILGYQMSQAIHVASKASRRRPRPLDRAQK
jgi:hypothetical protein